MKKCSLPDGLKIFCVNPAEAKLLHEDIFQNGSYFKHGITVEDGAVVFDVGANIGLFALAVHRRARGVRVCCFEPMPPLFEILAENVKLHGIEAALFPFALSSAPGHADFAYYPQNTALSGQYADAAVEEELARRILRNKRPDIEPFLDRLMEGRFATHSYSCEMRRLSDVISEQGIRRIDLLKIDTEKAEADVVSGLTDADWGKVRQVVMEVHDLNGRLDWMREILHRQGFTTCVDQTQGFEGTGVFDLFAFRG